MTRLSIVLFTPPTPPLCFADGRGLGSGLGALVSIFGTWPGCGCSYEGEEELVRGNNLSIYLESPKVNHEDASAMHRNNMTCMITQGGFGLNCAIMNACVYTMVRGSTMLLQACHRPHTASGVALGHRWAPYHALRRGWQTFLGFGCGAWVIA